MLVVPGVAAALVAACGGDDGSGTTSSPAVTSSSSASSTDASTASSTTSSTVGSGGSGGSGGQGGMGGAGGSPGDVTGNGKITWYSEGASVDVPRDFSTGTVEALVPKGGGQWDTIAGQGMADGTLVIHGVPATKYVLHIGRFYIVTSARDLDLGTETGGRTDAVVPMADPTNLAQSIDNLKAWNNGDDIEWFVGNTGTFSSILNGATIQNGPAAGDVALNLTLDWTTTFGAFLLDSAKGDVLYTSQLSASTVGMSGSVSTATRFAAFPSVTQTDGVDGSADGSFVDVTLDQSIALDWHQSDFDAYTPLINPAAFSIGTNFFVDTLPGGGMFGQIGNAADDLIVSVAPGSVDEDFGSIAYGNPYPASWGAPFGALIGAHLVPFTAPGATSSSQVFARIGATAEASTFGNGPISPPLAPPTGLAVNGMDAFMDQTGVGLTPTLSWTAPAVGMVAVYRLNVIDVQNNAGATSTTSVARIITKDTTVDVPTGIFVAGHTYTILVEAQGLPVDTDAHPFRNGLPLTFADAITNLLSP